MPKIQYDKESKIISIKVSNKKSVDSDVQDNVVVDYDKNNNITNIDIMDIDFNEFKDNKIYFEEIIKEKVKVGSCGKNSR
ncbi:DUF2283 domain-containing protein [Candidatus Parcubacteria bacterium]|nr:DUF2283 domain-containing protein [Patescibacteria group bacterium]MCG2690856.1 DUF2283 domain-containing protein [Candidatus Parcubacteria bacterium]